MCRISCRHAHAGSRQRCAHRASTAEPCVCCAAHHGSRLGRRQRWNGALRGQAPSGALTCTMSPSKPAPAAADAASSAMSSSITPAPPTRPPSNNVTEWRLRPAWGREGCSNAAAMQTTTEVSDRSAPRHAPVRHAHRHAPVRHAPRPAGSQAAATRSPSAPPHLVTARPSSSRRSPLHPPPPQSPQPRPRSLHHRPMLLAMQQQLLLLRRRCCCLALAHPRCLGPAAPG